ncbi:MAG: hypothetical protein DWQ07_08375 [Chloroflexi bacterium]|nr:MAG: hypothetical protein DWQ07_08375 [Chloroflexota bacterium]MBL1193273.1 hypothetical protein [Chloroflexota bacterium]
MDELLIPGFFSFLGLMSLLFSYLSWFHPKTYQSYWIFVIEAMGFQEDRPVRGLHLKLAKSLYIIWVSRIGFPFLSFICINVLYTWVI